MSSCAAQAQSSLVLYTRRVCVVADSPWWLESTRDSPQSEGGSGGHLPTTPRALVAPEGRSNLVPPFRIGEVSGESSVRPNPAGPTCRSPLSPVRTALRCSPPRYNAAVHSWASPPRTRGPRASALSRDTIVRQQKGIWIPVRARIATPTIHEYTSSRRQRRQIPLRSDLHIFPFVALQARHHAHHSLP